MDDFAIPSAASKDQIFVSWSESWDVGRYVDEYLRERRYVESQGNREIVLGCMDNFPARTGMVTKVNMDFWLDSNQLPLAPIPQAAPAPAQFQAKPIDF